jgi:hypothetical protein
MAGKDEITQRRSEARAGDRVNDGLGMMLESALMLLLAGCVLQAELLFLKMPCLNWRCLSMVITTISKSKRRFNQFCWIGVV